MKAVMKIQNTKAWPWILIVLIVASAVVVDLMTQPDLNRLFGLR